MATPATADWAALIRLTRCLIARPRCVYHFPWQDDGGPLRVYVDTDSAGRFTHSAIHARRGVR
eukprot:15482305-Alexandrium_andersonii.AAC.1